LKKNIVDVYDQIDIARDKVSIIPELKREKIRLESELNKLEIKSRALSDDCNVKINIHNYNNLMKTKPDIYEKIRKIQVLSKKLIAKSEEVNLKDKLIQEKEKLYIDLKKIVAREPREEVLDQLEVFEGKIKDYKKQIKLMEDDLELERTKYESYKYEHQGINEELQSLKSD